MKYLSRIVLLVMAIVLPATALQAKKKAAQQQTVYAFAVGTSLQDSTYYMTPIEALDSAVVDNKTKFLVDRSLYSYQLKVYLDHTYKKPHTCAVFFATKRSKLDSHYTQLRRQYTHSKSKGFKLVELPVDQFHFINVNQTVHHQ